MKTVFVISGPSGVGKSTLIRHVLEQVPEAALSVSCTTRAPRKMEVHGREYYFISQQEFREHLKNNDFIEFTECYGNCYGTLKQEILDILARVDICILDVDFIGAYNILERKVMSKFADIRFVGILILPPSFKELRARLISRCSETENSINVRLQSFNTAQLNYYEPIYDHILINSNLDTSQQKLIKILKTYQRVVPAPKRS